MTRAVACVRSSLVKCKAVEGPDQSAEGLIFTLKPVAAMARLREILPDG
jgi:hypothetical protein